MASLNTLRTKFGIVLSIIIALALLAFILSLKTEMGFSGNDPRVGVIDGEKINYSEYYDQYEQIKQPEQRAGEATSSSRPCWPTPTWQALIAKHVLTPGFDRMGLRVTELGASGDGQRHSMPSQAFYQCFRRSPHGCLQRGCRQPSSSRRPRPTPGGAARGAQLNEQARLEREVQKYSRTGEGRRLRQLAGGRPRCRGRQQVFLGQVGRQEVLGRSRFAVQSVVGVDLKAYYNSHKDMFKQTPVAHDLVCRVRGRSHGRRPAGAREERRRRWAGSSPPPRR
ncbi:MAG: SurA N-terminal domain-containing protein [Alistipes shahii]